MFGTGNDQLSTQLLAQLSACGNPRTYGRGELLIEEGSLYPALQRLELNGWVDGEWGVTPNKRRARIFKITAAGRKQLTVETRKYAKLTLAIARVMAAE